MSAQTGRRARLEARISEEALGLVRRAAEIEGRSVSDFVVAAAQQAARRTIQDTAIVHLAIEEQQRFLEALINPPEPNDALRKAAEAHKRLAVGTR